MDRRDQSQSTAGASAGASGLVLTNGSNAGFVFCVGILVPDQMVEEMVEFHWIRVCVRVRVCVCVCVCVFDFICALTLFQFHG